MAETIQAARQHTSGLVGSFHDAYLVAGLVCLAGVACAVFVGNADRDRAAPVRAGVLAREVAA